MKNGQANMNLKHKKNDAPIEELQKRIKERKERENKGGKA